MQEFFARPIKVINAYIGREVIIFKNAGAIRVNKELKGQKEVNHL